jgi:hypothetical protein
MNFARNSHTVSILADGKVLVAGGLGYDAYYSGYLNSTELYDPSTGLWTMTSSMSTARAYHTATILTNGTVLVAGGFGYDEYYSGYLNSTELYDASTGLWTMTGNMSAVRYGHIASILMNGKVLVAGGYSYVGQQFISSNSAELYDPSTGFWTITSSMSGARAFHTATILTSGKVLIAGGYGFDGQNYYLFNSAELYDPSTGLWIMTGNMSAIRYGHTASILTNGNVLVAGGYTFDGQNYYLFNSTELYDPSTGLWTRTGSMTAGRYLHTASVLANGKVLVAGGLNTVGNQYFNSTEIYDSLTGLWTNAGEMITAREGHASASLLNGTVLTTGGLTNNGTTNSTELYA